MAIGLRRDMEKTLEMQAQCRCRIETTAHSDLFHGLAGGFQQTLRLHNTLLEYPAIRSRSQGCAKTACEGPPTHCSSGRQLFHGKLSVEVSRDPGQRCTKRIVFIRVRQRRLDILRLP